MIMMKVVSDHRYDVPSKEKNKKNVKKEVSKPVRMQSSMGGIPKYFRICFCGIKNGTTLNDKNVPLCPGHMLQYTKSKTSRGVTQ